jgi:dTDP-4-dehydrorhamnose 3,5-epimerase
MQFEALPIPGAYSVIAEPHEDERGFFARIWSSAEFAERGLAPQLAECSLSSTPKSRTIRGLHYQVAPHAEAKFVVCLRGSIWDVIVDLRSDSPTYRRWHGIQLESGRLQAVYVPEGLAHGFITLEDDVLLLYQISEPYDPGSARGIRWDDPAIGIAWPAEPVLVGARDRSFPALPVPPA